MKKGKEKWKTRKSRATAAIFFFFLLSFSVIYILLKKYIWEKPSYTFTFPFGLFAFRLFQIQEWNSNVQYRFAIALQSHNSIWYFDVDFEGNLPLFWKNKNNVSRKIFCRPPTSSWIYVLRNYFPNYSYLKDMYKT